MYIDPHMELVSILHHQNINYKLAMPFPVTLHFHLNARKWYKYTIIVVQHIMSYTCLSVCVILGPNIVYVHVVLLCKTSHITIEIDG